MSRPPSSRLAEIEETLRRMETPRPGGTGGTVPQRALMQAGQEPRHQQDEEDGESDCEWGWGGRRMGMMDGLINEVAESGCE